MTEKSELEIEQLELEMTSKARFVDSASTSSSVEVDTAVPSYISVQNGPITPVPVKNFSGTGSSVASYKYRVYPWRWLMLVAVCLLNVSNGMMWLSFSPVPALTAVYYGISVSDVDMFSIIFFIVSLVVGFVAIILLDKVGLKVPLYIGAAMNLIGSGLRLLSSIDFLICSPVPKAAFYVALLGQAMTAVAQPFSLYAPTTLAAVWFGPKERALCTNFASVSNPIGLAIALLATPYIVTTVDQIPTMLWIYTIPAGVTFLLTLVAFWWKEPPIPPASSGGRDHIPPFFKGLLQVLKNWSFWVLLIFWGGAAGMFNALVTLLPQILCPYGYSDRDSGLWGALMIFFGLGGATVAGIIIDYTKMYKDVSIVSIGCAIISLVWFMEVSTFANQHVLVASSLCAFGFFALAQIPVCMELGVEITYPVAESISSGLLWSAAQVLGIAIVFISQVLTKAMSPEQIRINQCGNDIDFNSSTTLTSCHQSTHNASMPDIVGPSLILTELGPAMIFIPTFTTILFVFYVVFFQPKYKRIAAERVASFEASVYVGNRQTK